MKKLYFIAILSILIGSFSAMSEELPDFKNSSFEGRHFLVGFMQNKIAWDIYGPQNRIFIATNQETSVDITFPAGNTISRDLPADTIIVIPAPDDMEVRISETPLRQLIEINSDVPVAVYALNSMVYSSDSYSMIPTSYWGKEYVVMSYPNDNYKNPPVEIPPEDSLWNEAIRNSEFMIMANEDQTEVEIIPKAITYKNHKINQPFKVTLNKNETYLVKSMSTPKWTGDLTGSIIRSNKPIGVLSGHVRTASPLFLSGQAENKDHLCEMLFPTNAWGMNYVTVPFGVNEHGEVFRVTNIEPDTRFYVETVSGEYEEFLLEEPGDFAEIEYLGEPAVWRSTKPIQIGQFMAHSGDRFDNPFYDPALVILPPVEQFVNRILFQAPLENEALYVNDQQFVKHRIMLIIHRDAIKSISLDDVYVSTYVDFNKTWIPGTEYYYAIVDVGTGKHEVVCDSGGFTGIMYGFGAADSYANVLGSSLNNPFEMDSIPPEISVIEECGTLRGEISEVIDQNSTGLRFVQVVHDSTVNYDWDIGIITDTSDFVSIEAWPVDPEQDGRFMIDFRDKNGNGRRFEYNYIARIVSLPDTIDFGNVLIDQEKCIEFEVENTGKDTVNAVGTELFNDDRLDVISIPPMPEQLLPGEKLTIRLCFRPKDIAALDDSMMVQFQCDTNLVYLKGNVLKPQLAVEGIDFGEVLIGRKAVDSLLIVNEGNLTMSIFSLDMTDMPDVFSIDTTGLFPRRLAVGDSLKIPVIFEPDQRTYYKYTIAAIDSFEVEYLMEITGTGVAPLFEDITIDWGERRIGTANDTTLVLTNSGNTIGQIQFERFASDPEFPEDYNIEKLSEIDNYVAPGKNYSVKLTFKPGEPKQYSTEAKYSIDWELHDTVSVNLLGYGTVPELETFDHDIDTVLVFNEKDTTVNILASFGNEDLFIDEIFIESGDVAQFDLDLDPFRQITVPKSGPDSLLSLPVHYNPQEIGPHSIVLGIRHDANPNYQLSVDYVTMTAFSIPDDTVEISSFMETPDIHNSCTWDNYSYTISNDGNVDLQVDTVLAILEKNTALFRWNENYIFPDTLKVDSSKTYHFDLFMKRGESDRIMMNTFLSRPLYFEHYFDTLRQDVEAVSYPLSVIPVEALESFPGDTVVMDIKGSFPTKVFQDVGLSIEISITQNMFLLLNKDAKFYLIDG